MKMSSNLETFKLLIPNVLNVNASPKPVKAPVNNEGANIPPLPTALL